MRSLNVAATGMLAQQLNVDVISNNIANLSTTGFKRQRAEFQDLLYQQQLRVGTTSSDSNTIVPAGVELGLGVKTGGVYRIHDQGTLISTSNKLDLAISGRGYFRIELPDGTFAYSRAGAFQLDPNGRIVTQEGYVLSPGITIPQNAIDVTINAQGQVLVTTPDLTTIQNVGQIEMYTFINEVGLSARGENLLLETVASGPPLQGVGNTDGVGAIRQGYLENSNVDAVREITQLVAAQRFYELNSRLITTSDEMLRTVSQAS